MKRKKEKFKKKSQGGERRKDEVTLDVNNFPALSDMSPVKAQSGAEKGGGGSGGFSGYADALRQKNKTAPPSPSPSDNAKDETDLTEQVQTLKVSTAESSQSEIIPVAIGALTGTPTSVEECEPVVSDQSIVQEINDSAVAERVEEDAPSPVKTIIANDSDSGNCESTPQEETHNDKDEATSENDLASETPTAQEEAPAPSAAPPAAWGNKRSFIDVVRKS